MAVHALPKSSFPALQDVSPEDMYDAIVNSARKEYAHYAKYKEKADGIPKLNDDWSERHKALTNKTVDEVSTEVLKKEWWGKIDAYVVLQHIRNDIYTRIIPVYNAAIIQCNDPPLDPATLIALQRLKVRITDIQGAYDATFINDKNQLIDQRQKMQELYNSILPTLETLRYTLNTLGKVIYSQDKEWGPKGLSSYAQWTAFVNWGVACRKDENALARPPEQSVQPNVPSYAQVAATKT